MHAELWQYHRRRHAGFGFQSQTPDVARDSYDSILPSFSLDGGTTDKTFEFAIESRKATVRTDKPIPLSQVRDLTLLRELQKELKLQ